MPFPLPDLRRTYGRSGSADGARDVRPYLLTGRELTLQRQRLRALIDWHAARVGERRAAVDFDELAQVAGDYRLARCLAACLQSSFRFVSGSLADAVARLDTAQPFAGTAARGDAPPATGERGRRLAEAGIAGPGDLRLRVFAAVAAGHGGFVTPERRVAALAEPAAALGLAPAELDDLLWLDAEGNQRLQVIAASPSPEALATAYNRRALATLLVRALAADLVLPAPDGAAVRRLYFLVKRHGLLCELALVEPALGPGGGVHVHLYGPLEVFGPRTRHGDRFAGVLLSLLYHFPDLEGQARLLLNEREYRLVLGPDVAAALGEVDPLAVSEPAGADHPTPTDDEDDGGATADGPPGDPPPAVVARPEPGGDFDSEVEARLFATLQGMARRGDASGWMVEREPEPLIDGTTVMVPDFVLARPGGRGQPQRRVYVEVIGFWTPAYRERKREKLRRLAENVPLILVVQEALAPHFEGLPFPVLTYKHRVAATDLIRVLDRHYVRPGEDATSVRQELAALLEALDPALGFVGVDELRRVLELPAVAPLLEAMLAETTAPGEPGGMDPVTGRGAPGWRWVPGVGVTHADWLAALGEQCATAVAAGGGSVPLDDLRQTVHAAGPAPSAAASEHLEALLGVLGYVVDWRSLFEATVRPAGDSVA